MGIMNMTEVGVFEVEDLYVYREQRDDMTVQLIEGELVVSPSPTLIHQIVVSELFGVLRAAAPQELRVVTAPLDLRVGDKNVLQPDLMVLPRDLRAGSGVGIPPVLAVEILSPSSRRMDLVAKPEVLARFGCAHYWVVDPNNAAVRAFRLRDGTYLASDVVQGHAEFSADEPFPVAFRPADLNR